jgi:hypothetical protein
MGIVVPLSAIGSSIPGGTFVVSFFGTTPGALIRTVSRLAIGVVAGFGGSVMRTVSFFGTFEEGFSSAIKLRFSFYLTAPLQCQTDPRGLH